MQVRVLKCYIQFACKNSLLKYVICIISKRCKVQYFFRRISLVALVLIRLFGCLNLTCLTCSPHYQIQPLSLQSASQPRLSHSEMTEDYPRFPDIHDLDLALLNPRMIVVKSSDLSDCSQQFINQCSVSIYLGCVLLVCNGC